MPALQAEGFALSSDRHAYQFGKPGWLAHQNGSQAAFAVDGGERGARLMLAALCSYENVGVARIFLTRPSQPAPTPTAPAWHTLDMQWPVRSSQQCLVNLGNIPPHPSELWVRVSSSRASATPGNVGNQVKLYGLFTQRNPS